MEKYAATCETKTIVLFVPTEASSVEQFDGFLGHYHGGVMKNVAAYQCKDNYDGAKGTVPNWINKGGHLLRSKAPQKPKCQGKNERGWTYYNADETDEFLGHSLKIIRTK